MPPRHQRKLEIKLTGVARASLGELLLDYEDFLRQRKLRQWDKNEPKALTVRGKYRSDESDKSDLSDWSNLSAEDMANTLICFINQASYLLWQQMKSQEKEFLEKGGFTERMYEARRDRRARQI